MVLAQSFEVVDASIHDLKGFDCGKEAMNTFLARYALKNMKLGLSRTWVLALNDETGRKQSVSAYYTLASTTVTRESVPFDKRLPGYPVPLVLLARLAVDHRHSGKGLGGKTLVAALRQCAALTEAGLPALGVVLDVLDESALGFYQHYEIFDPFTDDPMRLFVPMAVVRQI